MPIPTIALLLKAETNNSIGLGSYFHITAVPVRLEDESVLGMSWSSRYTEEREPWTALDALEVRCQNSQAEAAEGKGSYAWQTEFRSPFSVDLDRAKSMVKVLTKIERALAKIEQTLGRPTTYAHYVLRVAQALRISTFVRFTEESRGFGFSRDFRVMNASEADYWISAEERRYIEKYQPKQPQALKSV